MTGLLLGLALLAGWPPSVNANTAADYFVKSLPGAPDGVPLLKMYAGYVDSLGAPCHKLLC
jgi:carboxypeptidase D